MKYSLTLLIATVFFAIDLYSQVHAFENNVFTFEKKLENGKILKLIREDSINIVTLHDSVTNRMYTIFRENNRRRVRISNVFLEGTILSMIYDGGYFEYRMYEYNSKTDSWKMVNNLILGYYYSAKPGPYYFKYIDINTILIVDRENKEKSQILRFYPGYKTEYYELKTTKIGN